MQKDPQKRIGHDDIKLIKSHSWFENVDWQEVENLSIPPPLKPDPFDRKSLEEMNSVFTGKREVISS